MSPTPPQTEPDDSTPWQCWVLTAVALALAVIHNLLPAFKVDLATWLLILIAATPLLRRCVKSITLPGGAGIEYQDLRRAEDKMKKAGLISAGRAQVTKTGYTSLSETQDDASLAMVRLRIELERALRQLASSKKIAADRVPLDLLVTQMAQKNLFSEAELAALQDTLGVLNRAAHGARIPPEALEWAKRVGGELLAAINSKAT